MITSEGQTNDGIGGVAPLMGQPQPPQPSQHVGVGVVVATSDMAAVSKGNLGAVCERQ
jgi:hypothetical protein